MKVAVVSEFYPRAHDPVLGIWAHRQAQAAIAAGEARLNGNGRLLIRKSGTEPVIRVMAEGDDKKLVKAVVEEICAAVVAA